MYGLQNGSSHSENASHATIKEQIVPPEYVKVQKTITVDFCGENI